VNPDGMIFFNSLVCFWKVRSIDHSFPLLTHTHTMSCISGMLVGGGTTGDVVDLTHGVCAMIGAAGNSTSHSATIDPEYYMSLLSQNTPVASQGSVNWTSYVRGSTFPQVQPAPVAAIPITTGIWRISCQIEALQLLTNPTSLVDQSDAFLLVITQNSVDSGLPFHTYSLHCFSHQNAYAVIQPGFPGTISMVNTSGSEITVNRASLTLERIGAL
jgi:hypothetical protein